MSWKLIFIRKWQRIVLPALMSVGGLLSSELSMQIISATHSPMILASMETTFDSTTDVLYHLFAEGAVVTLEETPFVKYGDVSGWLTSPLFGLRHARSREAERVSSKMPRHFSSRISLTQPPWLKFPLDFDSTWRTTISSGLDGYTLRISTGSHFDPGSQEGRVSWL